jgi:hypothetical protein
MCCVRAADDIDSINPNFFFFADALEHALRSRSLAFSPAMIQAARKEGMVAFYTAMAIPAAETLGKTFEAKYPGIAVRVKRAHVILASLREARRCQRSKDQPQSNCCLSRGSRDIRDT